MNINITSKAVEKLKELIEKEGQALKHIRILISGIG
jgi:Fe-S cluster assembly iron-binding protein IscA